MVAEYGMSELVGPLSLLDGQRNVFLQGGSVVQDRQMSEQTSRVVDAEIRRIVHDGLERARALVRHNRAYLEKLAARLLTIESIEGDEVRDLLRGAKVPPQAVPAPLRLRPAEDLHQGE